MLPVIEETRTPAAMPFRRRPSWQTHAAAAHLGKPLLEQPKLPKFAALRAPDRPTAPRWPPPPPKRGNSARNINVLQRAPADHAQMKGDCTEQMLLVKVIRPRRPRPDEGRLHTDLIIVAPRSPPADHAQMKGDCTLCF